MVKIFKQLCEFASSFICSTKPLLGWKTCLTHPKTNSKIPLKNMSFYPQQKKNLSPGDSIRDLLIPQLEVTLRPLSRVTFSPSQKGHQQNSQGISSWWLNQPIWKIWVKMGIFHLTGVKSTKTFELPPPTPLKFNIAPGNGESQKETHLPTIIFQVPC